MLCLERGGASESPARLIIIYPLIFFFYPEPGDDPEGDVASIVFDNVMFTLVRHTAPGVNKLLLRPMITL